ncbi:DUF2254 domain-containing protein [Marinobacterium sp. MBR-109]|jgi:uncharacterized membrane protein|uniref:DUF2254 domain-containing protein n=1 Tax=Marinobacterium sp. MBR-109 TaxID=3156462 RepID=UPI003398816A
MLFHERYLWLLRYALRKIWVRVAGFALLAILSLVVARMFSGRLPVELTQRSGAAVVEDLLTILATSMLAVTTFSLSIAVSAFAAAANSATPRATALLQEDNTTQNVLATFIGSFVFSLVGLIALNAGLYDESSRSVLFAFTIAVIGWVVFALIRWTNHLMNFGRMSDTLGRVEVAATDSLAARIQNPYLGGRRLFSTPPQGQRLHATATGYVQHIDMPALQGIADKTGANIYLCQLPGHFVYNGKPLMVITGAQLDSEAVSAACAAVVLGAVRTFAEDPRFGLIVMAEIASRALSPAVNDPGTAIDVVGRLLRVLSLWSEQNEPEPSFPGIHVPVVSVNDLVTDAFRPLARDGAALVEVQCRLIKALLALKCQAPEVFGEAVNVMLPYIFDRMNAAGVASADMDEVMKIVGGVQLSDN